jgi:DNA-binding XRE family transcriptional regulator
METHKIEGAPRAEPEPAESAGREAPQNGGEGKEGAPAPPASTSKKGGSKSAPKRVANNTRQLRMERMMSKAELARRAGVSTLTIDRIERGMNCRMDTKRKIIEALGLKPSDRSLVFAEDD